MYILSYAGLLLGLIILTLLLTWHGLSEIFYLLLTSGWYLLSLPIVWIPSFISAVVSWRLLFPISRTPPFIHLLMAHWMGRAINTLLPVATIGGEIAKARLVTLWGTSGINTSASVLVNKTVQALSLIPWGIIGTFLLFYLAIDNEIAVPAMIGISLLGIGIFGFILVQRAGMVSYMAKFMSKFIRTGNRDSITNNAGEIDLVVLDLYRNQRRFTYAVLWQTLGLILETTEVWLACYFLGHPIDLLGALMLKSLTSTLNNIAFFVPNGYGIQEGGYVMVGSLLGLTPDFSLALSLATRIRELFIDLPGLLVWQHIEGKWFFIKKRSAS